LKFIHTADWHLGRQFHNVSLIEDQRYLLEQLVTLADDVEAQAFIIAGDVFDRAVPNPDAVALLDDFLAEMTLGLDIPVIMIAGNHDSPGRLGFGSRLLRKAGVFVFGQVDAALQPVVINDAWGPVHFFALPYAEPAVVRDRSGEGEVHNHEQAIAYLASAARAQVPEGQRSVCIAHCFAAGGEESESERPLSVGGSGAVSRKHFDGFTYTALGHLHRPQGLGERIRYSGSLMKYSFSEIPHRKSASVVPIDADGAVEVVEHPLQPRRDLRRIEGELADLIKGPAPGENPEDFVLARLTDRKALLDPMGRLREVYPNILHIERSVLEQASPTALEARQPGAGDEQLFADFFEEVTGGPLSEEEAKAFVEVYDAVRRAEREAHS
jgi:exonuclease SbcD